MTEAMQGLLNDAKRNKFSTIDASLSDDGRFTTAMSTSFIATRMDSSG